MTLFNRSVSAKSWAFALLLCFTFVLSTAIQPAHAQSDQELQNIIDEARRILAKVRECATDSASAMAEVQEVARRISEAEQRAEEGTGNLAQALVLAQSHAQDAGLAADMAATETERVALSTTEAIQVARRVAGETAPFPELSQAIGQVETAVRTAEEAATEARTAAQAIRGAGNAATTAEAEDLARSAGAAATAAEGAALAAEAVVTAAERAIIVLMANLDSREQMRIEAARQAERDAQFRYDAARAMLNSANQRVSDADTALMNATNDLDEARALETAENDRYETARLRASNQHPSSDLLQRAINWHNSAFDYDYFDSTSTLEQILSDVRGHNSGSFSEEITPQDLIPEANQIIASAQDEIDELGNSERNAFNALETARVVREEAERTVTEARQEQQVARNDAQAAADSEQQASNELERARKEREDAEAVVVNGLPGELVNATMVIRTAASAARDAATSARSASDAARAAVDEALGAGDESAAIEAAVAARAVARDVEARFCVEPEEVVAERESSLVAARAASAYLSHTVTNRIQQLRPAGGSSFARPKQTSKDMTGINAGDDVRPDYPPNLAIDVGHSNSRIQGQFETRSSYALVMTDTLLTPQRLLGVGVGAEYTSESLLVGSRSVKRSRGLTATAYLAEILNETFTLVPQAALTLLDKQKKSSPTPDDNDGKAMRTLLSLTMLGQKQWGKMELSGFGQLAYTNESLLDSGGEAIYLGQAIAGGEFAFAVRAEARLFVGASMGYDLTRSQSKSDRLSYEGKLGLRSPLGSSAEFSLSISTSRKDEEETTSGNVFVKIFF